MSSEAVAEELPKIAPIRTAAARDGPVATPQAPEDEGAATTTVTPAAEEEEEEEEVCVTPKSEEHVLKPSLVCPPAPRKPRPLKRKTGPPPQGFFAVPRDLSLVFPSVSNLHPPKKRIRVR